MNSNPRQHVLPGQPLRLAAEQVNAINKMMRVGAGGSGGPIGIPEPARNIILCKNDSGSSVARWGVLEISGVVFDPADGSDAEATFTSTPCVTGVTPTDPHKPFVIAVEPIASGKIGRAAVSGVVQCQLDVQVAGDIVAGSKPGSTAELLTGAGSAAIVWKQGGAGTGKWGMVRLENGAHGSGARFGEVSAAWNKGTTATVTHLYPDGSVRTPATFDALNQFVSLPAPAAGETRFVMCILVDATWMLIAAEC